MGKIRMMAATGAALALACALTLAGCGSNATTGSTAASASSASAAPSSSEASSASTAETAGGGMASVANPWSDAATAEAAAEGAGVGGFALPGDGDVFEGGEVHWMGYQYMEGLAEADGAIGSAEFTVRKGLESAAQEVADGVVDVSGDWSAYAHTWDVDAGGVQVSCSGNEDGRAMKATWESGGYSYALLVRGQGDVRDTYGLGEADIAALAGVIG